MSNAVSAEGIGPIAPRPPYPRGALPFAGSGFSLLGDAHGFLVRSRERLGDTFAMDVFGRHVLFVFSPVGVKNLWALPEAEASKGLADFELLRHKVPAELFDGRRTYPHTLFAKDDVRTYLENLRLAAEQQWTEFGDAGRFEVFELTRRLGHRMGLASWGGLDATSSRHLDRLIPLLDRLDSSESFVHPHKAFWTILTRKARERHALAELEAVFGEILSERDRTGADGDDLFSRICIAWEDADPHEREIGIARDVILVHMASQSNLFAAMAWTLIHLLQNPALLEAVRGGDHDLLDRCAHESIRLRQRSIVLRRVLSPVTIADEKTEWHVTPGSFIATQMSVTNTSALTGLDEFDPANYEGQRFQRTRELPSRELVTTFGHGKHACPAQSFSIRAIRLALSTLLEGYDLEAEFRDPQPRKRQIGGVARADRRCPVRYRVRTKQEPA